MARITHVKAAQQRYKMVPVMDEETGQQKTTPVMVKGRDGVERQKTTKLGKPVVMKVSVTDKTQPLPPRTCESCRKPIDIGTPYQHVTPKSGPYGGRTRYRHASCPTWQPWDLSSALWARIAQIVASAEEQEITEDSETDDAQGILNDAASEIHDLAQEKEDGADNIENGFGHETEQSAELRQQSEDLNSWADDMENASLPDKPDEVDDPGDEPEEPDEDSDDWAAWKDAHDTWETVHEEYETYLSESESWLDEVQSAVSDLLGQNPC